jgi:hypothetical protein
LTQWLETVREVIRGDETGAVTGGGHMNLNPEGVRTMIGKTITAVIIRECFDQSPNYQLLLVFADGTYFEIYGNEFCTAHNLSKGDAQAALKYADGFGGMVYQVDRNTPERGRLEVRDADD